MIGKVLGGTYRVERRIGGGGMGVVYEVMQLRINRRFAAKVLTRELSSNPEAVARFRQEAMVTGMLGNPHIVQVLDFNHTEDNTPYIIMELLEGEDLARRLRREKRLPVGRVAAIFKQVCSALYCAHEQGIVHRDLKPGNIFICNHEEVDDYVKVVDFGISKVLGVVSKITRPEAVMGSPSYMSPEQALARSPEIEPTSDIFSMGSILYLVLAGVPPFSAETRPGLLHKIVHDEPPPLGALRPGIPPAVDKVIRCAMDKTPARRYQNMVEFWEAFALAVGADVGELKISGVSVEEQSTLIYSEELEIDLDETSGETRELSSADLSEDTDLDGPVTAETASEVVLDHRATVKEGGAPAVDLEAATVALAPSEGSTLSTGVGQMGKRRRRRFSAVQVVLLVLLALSIGAAVTFTLATSSLFAGRTDGVEMAASSGKVLTLVKTDAGLSPAGGDPGAAAGNQPEAKNLPVATPVAPKARPAPRTSPRPRPPRRKPRKAAPAASPHASKPAPAPAARPPRPAAPRPRPRPAGKPATLRVITLGPAGMVTSDIILDGKKVGQSPMFLKDLRSGSHTVEARSAGFRAVTRRATLNPGKNKLVFKLQKL